MPVSFTRPSSFFYYKRVVVEWGIKSTHFKVHPPHHLSYNSGPLKTPLLMDFLNTPEKLERRMNHLPMGRFGEAIEQAKAVLFCKYFCGEYDGEGRSKNVY